MRIGIVLAAWVMTAVGFGQEYFVQPATGNDGNDGLTSATAFATLARGVRDLQPGDTLRIVDPGEPIRESLRFPRVNGTPEQPVTVDGGGALLCGFDVVAAEKWSDAGGGLFEYSFPAALATNCHPLLRIDGREVKRETKGDELPEGGYAWIDHIKLRYRPVGGRLPDMLEVTVRESCVQIQSSSYIRIRNLRVEGAHNDGFNMHGDCKGLVFENIEGRYNGDDGFSAHEDVTAAVCGGYFHHNSYGIEDISASQTSFFGVRVENNRTGAHFAGGFHALVDCTVRDNETAQVLVDPGTAPGGEFGGVKTGPMYAGLVFLRNTGLDGGKGGLVVQKGASAMAIRCRIRGAENGLVLRDGATVDFRASSVDDCVAAEVVVDKSRLMQDQNRFYPGRFTVDGTSYGAEQWSDVIAAWQTPETSSVVAPPKDAAGE